MPLFTVFSKKRYGFCQLSESHRISGRCYTVTKYHCMISHSHKNARQSPPLPYLKSYHRLHPDRSRSQVASVPDKVLLTPARNKFQYKLHYNQPFYPQLQFFIYHISYPSLSDICSTVRKNNAVSVFPGSAVSYTDTAGTALSFHGAPAVHEA